MNYNIAALLPSGFPGTSRVWIYQSNRALSEQEEKDINEQLQQFAAQWTAHAEPVKGWGKVLFSRFIILMADESDTAVSGCSTDSSVRFIKGLEEQYNLQLFNRLLIPFLIQEKIVVMPLSQVDNALGKGLINEETLLFNTTVLTKAQLEQEGLIPVRDSWIAARLLKAQP